MEHDIAYRCGGSAAARKRADRRLEKCVTDQGHPALARLMDLGVRVGAPAWIPIYWRWGFGWDFPYRDAREDGPPSAREAGASPHEGSPR